MPCLHRFHNELLPNPGIEFLFIGTFNPIWDVKSGDNPDYFYSRQGSLFWCILPHAFRQNCLIDQDRSIKEKFCVQNKIGLTDLIYSIENVDKDNKEHKQFLIKGFKDEDFESKELHLEIDFYTSQISGYIKRNNETLKGVFFTRKTAKDIPRIWSEWENIRKTCKDSSVYCNELSSPSPRGGSIRSKIFSWRKEIDFIKQKHLQLH
jgi:hypothetical protein